MAREGDWTPAEFELLISRSDLEDREVAEVLQARTGGAVAVVRAGIHEYHSGNTEAHGMLSEMMKARLEAQPRSLVCRLCKDPV